MRADDVSQSSISTQGSDELNGPVSVRTGLTEDAVDQREHAMNTDCWLKTRCCQLTMQGFETRVDGEYDETWSKESSARHQSEYDDTLSEESHRLDPRLSYNTAERLHRSHYTGGRAAAQFACVPSSGAATHLRTRSAATGCRSPSSTPRRVSGFSTCAYA